MYLFYSKILIAVTWMSGLKLLDKFLIFGENLCFIVEGGGQVSSTKRKDPKKIYS